jgi:hypothetical protein
MGQYPQSGGYLGDRPGCAPQEWRIVTEQAG